MTCSICGMDGHNSRTRPGEHQTCPNCGRMTANMNDYSERHDSDHCSPFTSPECWAHYHREKLIVMLVCTGCGEPIKDEGSHIDFNGEDWHESCFEVSGGSPTYCYGIMYENGESFCSSCREPI